MGPRLAWAIDVPRELAQLAAAADAAAAGGRERDQARARAQDRGRPCRRVRAPRRRPAAACGRPIPDSACARRAIRRPPGLGLPNLRARLAALYGNAAALDARRQRADGHARHDRFPFAWPMPMATDRVPAGRTTAIIADDEPRLADYLKSRLAALWPELVIAGIAANGPDAQALLAREAPDIAFLDIRMPGLTGLDVARRADAGVHVVFVTAFDQYAVEAFERAAVDYLLKPVSTSAWRRPSRGSRRACRRVAPAPDWRAALACHRTSCARWPPRARAAGVDSRVDRPAGAPDRRRGCLYFQANDKYTSVFTADGEALIRTPLKELVAQLDPHRFWQVHRGTIVNVAHVADDDARSSRPGHADARRAGPRRSRSRARTRTCSGRCNAQALGGHNRAMTGGCPRREPSPPRRRARSRRGCARDRRRGHATMVRPCRPRPRAEHSHAPRIEGAGGAATRRALPSRSCSPPASRWSRRSAGGSPARSRSCPTPATWSPTRRRWGSRCSRTRIARRPPSTRASYGYGRAEVLAAFVNAIAMLAIVAAIGVEAVRRLLEPAAGGRRAGDRRGALAGLAVNVVAAWVLSRASGSVNARAALLHVMGDLLGSVAALVAGGVIVGHRLDADRPDPVDRRSALLILRSTWQLLRQTTGVLMEARARAPRLRRDRPGAGVAARRAATCTTCTCGT